MSVNKTKDEVEYLGQIANAGVAAWFENEQGPSKSFRQTLSLDQAKEFGLLLLGAWEHSRRHKHMETRARNIRTKFERIDEVIVTTHSNGQITVLARPRKK